jgi:hypothetical protein
MESFAVEQVFDAVSDAIVYAFQHEQTSLLSLDRICEVVQCPSLFLNAKKDGLIPCSTIVRRRISSTLSSCALFIRAGPPRTCLWAIRPNNPLFLSDSVISSSIEQMLTNSGPMTLEQFTQSTQLNGTDVGLFERFLAEHATEFARHSDDTYWFTGQPRPIQRDFESISHALVFALSAFPEGASVEELTWYLCLSTVNTVRTITRRNVSRELSRRTDLFDHLARARYRLFERPLVDLADGKAVHAEEAPPPPPFQVPVPQMPSPVPYPFFTAPLPELSPPKPPLPTDDDDFDPFAFFGHDFQFAFE